MSNLIYCSGVQVAKKMSFLSSYIGLTHTHISNIKRESNMAAQHQGQWNERSVALKVDFSNRPQKSLSGREFVSQHDGTPSETTSAFVWACFYR